MSFENAPTQPIVPQQLPKPLIVATRPLPFIDNTRRAAHFSMLSRHITQGVAIHATCGAETKHSAEDCQRMFADAHLKPARSAHYVVDADSICLCVPEPQIAWHCGHRGNQSFIGVELCGLASQTRGQWLDALSLPMLQHAAALVADVCKRNAVPLVTLQATDIRAGLKGITTHNEIRKAWSETDHTDPGAHFPMDEFLAAVKAA